MGRVHCIISFESSSVMSLVTAVCQHLTATPVEITERDCEECALCTGLMMSHVWSGQRSNDTSKMTFKGLVMCNIFFF